MTGADARCTRCSFRVLTGHSHHEGVSACVCTACLARFALEPESAWGPERDEAVPLVRDGRPRKARRKSPRPRWEPAGPAVVCRPASHDPDSPDSGTFRYDLARVACPDCGARALADVFGDGTPCPRCLRDEPRPGRRGTLTCTPVMY